MGEVRREGGVLKMHSNRWRGERECEGGGERGSVRVEGREGV